MDVSTEQILSEVGSLEQGGSTPEATQAPKGPWYADKMNESVEYTIEGGRKVSEPFEMLLKRAGLGYHAAQRLHEVNSKAEQYAKLDARIKELQQWEEYDKYAKDNPDWHKHLQDSWTQRDQLKQQNSPQTIQELQALKQEIAEMKKFNDEIREARNKEKQSSEDKQFLDEIGEVSKRFGVDLDQADENGESLAWRVTKHMQTMGLDGSKKGHFTMAFKDYNFDNLVGRQKEQAVEQHAKNQAELKKAGIREVTRTPKTDALNGYRPGMSSSQIENEALEYLQSLRKA